VFFGIAVLVYHFAIKAVGIAMAIVEVGYFWCGRCGSRCRRCGSCATSCASICTGGRPSPACRHRRAAGACRGAARRGAGAATQRQCRGVFAPAEGGQVNAVRVKNGDRVAKGRRDRPRLPRIAYKLAQARTDLALIEWQLGIQGVAPALMARSMVGRPTNTKRRWRAIAAERQIAKLEVKAPIAGRIVDLSRIRGRVHGWRPTSGC
jgi:putative peptide zinc metalloprotease protein